MIAGAASGLGQFGADSVASVLASAVPMGSTTTTTGGLAAGAPGLAGWAFDNLASGISGWVLGAVEFFVGGALKFLATSAAPDVGAVWFSGPASPYAQVRAIALAMVAGFVFLALIQGLVAGDVAGMVRVVALRLPAVAVGTIATTAVVSRLLELTDALSGGILERTGEQAVSFLGSFTVAASAANAGFAVVVLGLVAVVAALALWVELLVRSALVYLLVAISPLGFAAAVWPAARGFLRRSVELLVAVVVSKLVIVIALAVGVAAMAGVGAAASGSGPAEAAGGAVGALLAGAVVLGLAAFSPFLVVKLVPAAEAALVAQGTSRGPLRGAQTALSSASSARMITRLSGPAPSMAGGPGPGGSRPGTPGGPSGGSTPGRGGGGSPGAGPGGGVARAGGAAGAGVAAGAGALVSGASTLKSRVSQSAATAAQRPPRTPGRSSAGAGVVSQGGRS